MKFLTALTSTALLLQVVSARLGEEDGITVGPLLDQEQLKTAKDSGARRLYADWSDDWEDNDDKWGDTQAESSEDTDVTEGSGSTSPQFPGGGCEDPVGSILATLKCIEEADATCASAGYDNGAFRKLHNGVDTNTNFNMGFWTGTFFLLDFILDVNHAAHVGPNQASIRYIETVTTTSGSNLFLDESTDYPFSQSFKQYEWALVTVDDDCKMILWDQYGDNQEQGGVVEAVDEIVCAVNPLCFGDN